VDGKRIQIAYSRSSVSVCCVESYAIIICRALPVAKIVTARDIVYVLSSGSEANRRITSVALIERESILVVGKFERNDGRPEVIVLVMLV